MILLCNGLYDIIARLSLLIMLRPPIMPKDNRLCDYVAKN